MTTMPFMTPEDFVFISDALKYSSEQHVNQRRKDERKTPYINHPIDLFNILVSCGVYDRHTLAGALLHDTIEDTGDTWENLEKRFGNIVADLVLEVSDDKSLPKPERKRLQIEHAPHSSYRAKLVKLADKISNMRDILARPPVGWPLERQQAYFDWAAAVLVGLRGTNEALEKAYEETLALRP